MLPTAASLLLTDAHDVLDLEQFLTRAAGVREGVARLVARGPVAAVHVAAAFPLMLGAEAPTIVGQRGVRLAREAELDVVVPIAELRDRLARLRSGNAGALELEVPPSRPSAPWTATLPLTVAWDPLGTVHDDAWAVAAREVASAVQASLPQDPGQPLVFQARDALWAAPREDLSQGTLAGAAFVAHAYGFLRRGGTSFRLRGGGWERLSAGGGTLLWRTRPA